MFILEPPWSQPVWSSRAACDPSSLKSCCGFGCFSTSKASIVEKFQLWCHKYWIQKFHLMQWARKQWPVRAQPAGEARLNKRRWVSAWWEEQGRESKQSAAFSLPRAFIRAAWGGGGREQPVRREGSDSVVISRQRPSVTGAPEINHDDIEARGWVETSVLI